MNSELSSKEDNRRSQLVSFVDIRASTGGIALGLESVGFTPALLVESDANARRTLAANRNWPVVDEIDDGVADFLARQGIGLLAGNLPSDGISVAGVSRQDDDTGSYARALELIAKLVPKAVLLVNVVGITQSRFADLRAIVESELRQLGYQLSWRVVDSADYGLPQARRRSILVALKSTAFSEFTWPTGGVHPPSVGEALFEQMVAAGWPGARQWSRLARGIAPTIVGGSKRHGGADLGPTRTKNIWYSLGVDPRGIAEEPPGPDFPIRTMPRLTNSMIAVLQGYPMDWKFVGAKTSVYRQIAEAVPPPTAAAIGREIRRALWPSDV